MAAMSDQPTAAEMWRRLTEMRGEQREQFLAINARLDKMLTTDGLTAHLGTYTTEMRHVREDVDEVKSGLKDNEVKTTNANRWAISAFLTAAGVIVGVVAIVASVVGA